MLTFFALAFLMPSADALIGLVLLMAVLAVVGWLVLYAVKVEPWRTVVVALGCIVLAVLILRTFTTWAG